MNDEEKLFQAIGQTQILRSPSQKLATFGVTNINYFLLTQPAYAENKTLETVVRQGKVIANRPRIVTPYYLAQLEGFSLEARKYFRKLTEIHGAHATGIYYTYHNEPGGMEIVGDNIPSVAKRISQDIDQRGDALAAIITGEDEMWDVSLMKFIFEMTNSSVENNVTEMKAQGLLTIDAKGVPMEARLRIEELFSKMKRGEIEPRKLKEEIEHWGLFEEYQDRFLALFRR
jgi:hypothetical protein